MSKQMYAQCTLERKEGAKTLRLVSWIFAQHRVGSRVQDENEHIWTVKSRGSHYLPEDVVNEQSMAHTRHRKATDI